MAPIVKDESAMSEGKDDTEAELARHAAKMAKKKDEQEAAQVLAGLHQPSDKSDKSDHAKHLECIACLPK